MPSKSLVAIRRLHKDGRFGKTFCKHFSPDVVEANPLADVAPGLLHHRVAIHVRQEAKAEPARLGERGQPIHGRRRRTDGLAHLSALLGSVKPSTIIWG